MPGGCISESKRVQAPLGAPVLWSLRFAPNHGFGPESASPPGLVQREALNAASGGIYIHRAEGGDTTTLGAADAVKPKNPKNLRPARAVNPHARKGVSKAATTL